MPAQDERKEPRNAGRPAEPANPGVLPRRPSRARARPREVRIKVEAAECACPTCTSSRGSCARPTWSRTRSPWGTKWPGRSTRWDRSGRLVSGQRVLLQAGEERGGRVHTRGVDYDGGWAEYALATASTLVPIPDDLPFEQAAIIPDAVSTPWAAITTTAQVRPAEAVGVWGIGGLGAHAVQLLRLIGAADHRFRSQPHRPGTSSALRSRSRARPRRPAAVRCGWRAHRWSRLGGGLRLRRSSPVREQALRLMSPAGRLVLVGLTDQP